MPKTHSAEAVLAASAVVGATGFEPATPWSRTKCATRLRYAPGRVWLGTPQNDGCQLPTEFLGSTRKSADGLAAEDRQRNVEADFDETAEVLDDAGAHK